MKASIELTKHYYQVQKRVNALPIVGRVAILIAVLLVVLLFWYLLVQRPLVNKQQKLQIKIADIIKGSEQSNLEVKDIIEKITGQTFVEEKKELSVKAKEIEQYLGVLNDEIIAPGQMTEILQNLLSSYNTLELTSYKISPKRILVNNTSDGHKIQLYEQDVKLELRGDYFSTLDYLEKLEHLPWRFFWDDIEYHVTSYPQASITIKIHTLGR